MSRAVFTFVLVAIVVPYASLQAEEPARQGGVIVGHGTLTLTGSNTDTGATMINGRSEPDAPGRLIVTGLGSETGTMIGGGTLSLTGGYSGGTMIAVRLWSWENPSWGGITPEQIAFRRVLDALDALYGNWSSANMGTLTISGSGTLLGMWEVDSLYRIRRKIPYVDVSKELMRKGVFTDDARYKLISDSSP